MVFNVDKITKILKTCKVVKYWEYKSLLDVIFYTVKYDKIGYTDQFFEEEKNETKLKLLKAFTKLCKKANIIGNNKIVIQIKTKENEIINVGWYDGKFTLGLGRIGDKWIKATTI